MAFMDMLKVKTVMNVWKRSMRKKKNDRDMGANEGYISENGVN